MIFLLTFQFLSNFKEIVLLLKKFSRKITKSILRLCRSVNVIRTCYIILYPYPEFFAQNFGIPLGYHWNIKITNFNLIISVISSKNVFCIFFQIMYIIKFAMYWNLKKDGIRVKLSSGPHFNDSGTQAGFIITTSGVILPVQSHSEMTMLRKCNHVNLGIMISRKMFIISSYFAAIKLGFMDPHGRIFLPFRQGLLHLTNKVPCWCEYIRTYIRGNPWCCVLIGQNFVDIRVIKFSGIKYN